MGEENCFGHWEEIEIAVVCFALKMMLKASRTEKNSMRDVLVQQGTPSSSR